MAKRKSNKQVKAMVESVTGSFWMTFPMHNQAVLIESAGNDGSLTGFEVGEPIVIYGNGDIKWID